MTKAMEVEMGILVTVNGRAIWRKTKKIKPECAGQLTDDLYDKVLRVAENELARLLNIARASQTETTAKK